MKKLPLQQQTNIIKSLDVKKHFKPIDAEVSRVCTEIHTILNNEQLTKDELEESIDQIKSSSKNKEVKTACKIAVNISSNLLSKHVSNNQKEGEASIIIENLRPFMQHCFVSVLDSVKIEW